MKKLYMLFVLLLFGFADAQVPEWNSLKEVEAFFDAHTDPIYIESPTDRTVILEYGSLSYDERRETNIPLVGNLGVTFYNHTDPNIQYLMMKIDSADYLIAENTGFFSRFWRSDMEARVLNWARASYQDRKRLALSERDVSAVSDEWRQLITETQRKDEIITYNRDGVQAVQEAIAKNKATVHVKLFPIWNGDSVYPKTTEAGLLFLRNAQGFDIEIHTLESLQNNNDTLLVQGVQEIEVNFKCLLLLDCRENPLRYRQNEGAEWQVALLEELLQSEDVNFASIRIVPKENGEQVPTQVIWGEGTHRVDRYYRGLFHIKRSRVIASSDLKGWSLINEVPMEQYIRSVVASEVQHSVQNPIEAFKAQAVLARSYVCHKAMVARAEGQTWDLDPTTYFQSYQGVAIEHGRVDQAVAETLGQVLMHKGEVALTLYHSCTNNQTYDDSPLHRARIIPRHVSCSFTYGHGIGMPQIVSYHLAREGWADSDSEPSRGATVPEDISRPWNYEDILYYFYSDVVLEHYENCLSQNQ